jgi:predicted deacylase
VAYYNYGAQTSKAKQMADALGFQWAIISENNPGSSKQTKYCSAEAVSKGIPTVAIEYGKLGQVEIAEANFIDDRLINMMKSIGIYEGIPEAFNLSSRLPNELQLPQSSPEYSILSLEVVT